MESNIEVEIRSFITEDQYKTLVKFFEENSIKVKDDFQETHYFNCKEDLRIQKNSSGAKVWMKKGKIHDDWREEIEIKIPRDDFEKMKSIFNGLGMETEIKWLRDRKQFDWNGIKVCLDFTQGYGHIIELEKITSPEEKERVLTELQEKLQELDIKLSPKEEFDKKFSHYKENWRELTEDDKRSKLG
jgi:predicted adenylyl cyclase CyaB